MKVAIILTGADGYKNTFLSVGEGLRVNGATVHYVSESRQINAIEPTRFDNQIAYIEDIEVTKEEEMSYLEKVNGLTFGDINFSDIDRRIWFNRRVYSFSEVLQQNARQFKMFDSMIREKSLDYIVYEAISNSLSANAYLACINNGVKMIALKSSFLNESLEVCYYGDDITQPIPIINEARTNNKWDLKNYEASTFLGQPHYMSVNKSGMSFMRRCLNKRNITKLLNFVRYSLSNKVFQKSYLYGSVVSMKYDMFRSNISIIKNNFLIKNKDYFLPKPEQYIFYAMHFHPESSTSVNAKYFNDEYTNIIAISNSLPYGQFLVVKDHPTGAGMHGEYFYHRLKYLPNVVFVDPKSNSLDLINGSNGVITVTGTIGFQALLLKKPVFHFAKTHYSDHPNAVLLTRLSDLTSALAKNHTVNEIDNIHLLNKLYKYSYDGEMPMYSEASINTCISITNALLHLKNLPSEPHAS